MSIGGEEVFAYHHFILFFRNPALRQMHLAVSNVHYLPVHIHIGCHISLFGGSLPEHIVAAYTGQFRQSFQSFNVRCINPLSNRFKSIYDLIALHLCQVNRRGSRKTDQICRQGNGGHHHQIPTFLTFHAILCHLIIIRSRFRRWGRPTRPSYGAGQTYRCRRYRRRPQIRPSPRRGPRRQGRG